MPTVLERKLEYWEHELLDLGKRNKMIHYRETKRSTIKLVEPSFDELFRRIAVDEEELTFKRPIDRNSDLRTFSMLALLENLSHPIPVSTGDIETESSILERQKTLKNLRSKARLALEEQGTNILYMIAGFVEWREEAAAGNSWVKSPLIMVPVMLAIESVNAPFVLKRYEEDIVVNPTLTYYFQEKYGIILPSFDPDEQSIDDFLKEMEELVDKRGWKITREISLGFLSFLKINMYRDLQNNRERLLNNNILRAISGENEALGEADAQLFEFNHDSVPPAECFQTVNADASQQDAILLSRKGVSYVMQGPPGTGKSQTITNIIAQALADGKKVLFVSEKMAALQVVYRRLQEVHLADFCLPLHSYKANKKEILEEIGKTLHLQLKKVKDEAISELYTLDLERQKLNKYASDLHSPIAPLNLSIYQVYGALNSLSSISDISFELPGIEEITKEQFILMQYNVSEYTSALNNMGDSFRENPWRGSTVIVITHDLIDQISRDFSQLADEIADLCTAGHLLERKYSFNLLRCWNDFVPATEVISVAVKMSGVPIDWVYKEYLYSLLAEATKNHADLQEYWVKHKTILQHYSQAVFDIDAQHLQKQILNTHRILSALITHQPSPCTAYSTYLKTINDISALLLESLRQIEEDIFCIQSATGYSLTANFENTPGFYELAQLVLKKPKITAEWFAIEDFAELKKVFSDAKILWSEFIKSQNEILQSCKSSVFAIPAQQMLNDLQNYQDIANRVLSFCCGSEIAGSMTLELLYHFKSQICPKVDSINQVWTNAVAENQVLGDILGFPMLTVCSDIKRQIAICKAALHPIYPQASWVETEQASKYGLLEKCRDTHEHINALKREISATCDTTVFELDYEGILKRYKMEYTSIFKWFKHSYRKDRKAVRAVYKDVVPKLPDSQIISLLQSLKSIGDDQVWLDCNQEAVLAFAGRYYQGTETAWDNLFESLAQFKQLSPLFDSTEDAVKILSITSSSDLQAVQNYLSYLLQLEPIIEIGEVLHEISDELSEESIAGLIDRLNSVVKNSKGFESVFKDVLSHSNNCNASYESLVDSLKKLAAYNGKEALIERAEKNLNIYFPHRYNGSNTDWDQISFDIDCFERIHSYFSGFSIDSLKELLLAQNVEKVLPNLQSNVTEESVNRLFEVLNSVVYDKKTKQCALGEASQLLEEVTLLYAQLKNCYEDLPYAANISQSWEESDANIEDLVFIQTIGCYYKDNANILANRYQERYSGVSTDWDEILDKLLEVKTFKQLLEQYNLPVAFGEFACSNLEAPHDFRKFLSRNDAVESINKIMSFAQSLFDGSFIFSSEEFYDVHHRLISCLKNIDLLEKQIDYRDTRKACCESGLESFIDAVEEGDPIILDIPQVFQKVFYKKWLDFAANKSEAVSGFRARVQNDRIKRFCELDKHQLQIAQMRIREKLISELPSTYRFLSAKDELSVLQHELGKKKRIMPLRKLFRSIPNLLLRLKPCLMMSPLSVSYFLEAETYQFDMIIFDEASQIFPEDAIGAILRGTQVIIAGDSKQLPPTNFFSTRSGGVYDGTDSDSDEEYDDIVSDSILEEATFTIPSRSLLWHYRSRHEHLIAFSNSEIYKNELITFPSSIGRTKDMGVEYIHVPTGIYEGRCNVREAQKCVMLIIDHLQHHPDRSLGIIAFSEKQQATIEEYVDKFRERNPQYEWFFNENRDEPFFVKNLENVQGDERDTIVFSICYAKDGNGRMFMRFGPLGHEGGERRLNVAITRAKYNVKLVGSILPADLNRVNSEGVKMLRSYIEFAMKGASVLGTQKQALGTDEGDDKFCEGVADFLEGHGYKIYRNVGCSDYTIDIAVENPDHPGFFTAGIECDGSTYVMAKTARDRDHLRSSILRSMGWMLYRVWSSDWIRNPEEAKRNLILFIEGVLKQPVILPAVPRQEMSTGEADGISDLVESVSQKEILRRIAPTAFELQEYTSAVWYNVKYPLHADNNTKIETLILYVVGIEQPIHRYLIHQRLAGAFGREKATSIVKNNIDPFLNHMQKTRLKNENEFFSFPTLTEIPIRKAGGRSIEHISIREIGTVMVRIAKNTFGISVEELTAETARLFGFERRGPKIAKTMSEAVDDLIKNGMLKIVDDKVQFVEELT